MEKEINMKKLTLILTLLFASLSTTSYAGGVTDDNNGNKGDIFVSTGENHGANSVGQWVDSSFLKGTDGKDGTNGVDGKDGKDGIDGTNGLNGAKGDKGDRGDRGKRGKRGKQGVPGVKGDQGQTGLQGEQGKGLDDRVEGLVELRLLDTKRTTWSVAGGYDFNNDVSIVQAKCTIKLGKSYTDKKIEDLETRLNNMEQIKQSENYELYTDGKSIIGIKSKF